MFGSTHNSELLVTYMKKRSQNKKTITRQTYKYRWFVLTREALSYYDGNPEVIIFYSLKLICKFGFENLYIFNFSLN